MRIAVAGHMVIVNIHAQPQGDGVGGIHTTVLRDEVNVEGARNWGLPKDIHDPSRPKVKKVCSSTGFVLCLLRYYTTYNIDLLHICSVAITGRWEDSSTVLFFVCFFLSFWRGDNNFL